MLSVINSSVLKASVEGDRWNRCKIEKKITMNQSHNIFVQEKPDWVSWEEIREVLRESHAENRENGIINAFPSLPSDEIRRKVGDNGKMFVAIDGKKVIGTYAVLIKNDRKWFTSGDYAYECFCTVLPEYRKTRTYFLLSRTAIDYIRKKGISLTTGEAHENNEKVLKLKFREGYRYVAYKACTDHYNVVIAKWLNEYPFPLWYIKLRFLLSKLYLKTRYKMVPGKGRVRRFGI